MLTFMKVLEMFSYVRALAGLRNDNRGVTAVEYGIMAAMISAILVGVIASFGTSLTTTFTTIGRHLTTGA